MFIIIVFSLSARAQVQERLTLNECITRALANNPALTLSKAKVRAAEARLSEATASLLPTIRLSGRVAEVSPIPEFSVPPPLNLKLFPSITEQYSVRLTLQQPLFTGLKLVKARSIAEFSHDVATFEAQKDENDVIFNVTTAYWNVYRSIENERVVAQSIRDVEQHLVDVQNFARQGLATDVDVMKVRVQLAELRVHLIEARNAIRVATMALNMFLGNPLETTITIADEPLSTSMQLESWVSMDLHALMDIAERQRPELAVSRARLAIASEQRTVARSSWFPTLYFQANYEYARPNQRILPLKDRWDGTWDVGLLFQWNVWDWLTPHYQTIQSEEAVRQSEAAIQQMKDMVQLEVAQQYYTVQSEREKVHVAREEVATAEESYRVATKKFKAGLLTSTELTDAETALLRAKLNEMQVTVEYCIALARLKRALGVRL